jgi:hypothetical protein
MSCPVPLKTKAGMQGVTDDMEEIMVSTGKLLTNKETLQLEFHAAQKEK